jgi:hypothetical protein
MNSKVNLMSLSIFFLTTLQPRPAPLPAKKDPKPIFLKGSIYSSELDKIPPFKIYDGGRQTTSDSDGFFSFKIEENEKNYIKKHVLICKDFRPVFSTTNTIKGMAVFPGKQYKLFSLKKSTAMSLQKKIDLLESEEKLASMRLQLIQKQLENQEKKLKEARKEQDLNLIAKITKESNSKTKELKSSTLNLVAQSDGINDSLSQTKKELETLQKFPDQENNNSWTIKEKTDSLKKKSFALPENCLIVCMNPKVVDRMQNWSFNVDSNFVCIPKIVLKKNVETRNIKKRASLERSSIKSMVSSLDFKLFHEDNKQEVKMDGERDSIKISMLR